MPAVQLTWEPNAETIELLERDLRKVEKLKARQCCFFKGRVYEVDEYHRQYIGVVVNGEHLVYINAFRDQPPPAKWQEEAVVVCDGGSWFWGALYNPRTRRFSALAMNGSS